MNRRMEQLGCIVAVITTVVVLGGWGTYRSAPVRGPWVPFKVHGATNVMLEKSGHRTWRLRYQAPGGPVTWYATLTQRLEAQGWTSSDPTAYAPLNRSYSRATSLGVATVWEWAFFSFDPRRPELAEVRVRRALDVPWWRRVRRVVTRSIRTVARPPLLTSAGQQP